MPAHVSPDVILAAKLLVSCVLLVWVSFLVWGLPYELELFIRTLRGRSRFPEQPWLWRADWRSRSIPVFKGSPIREWGALFTAWFVLAILVYIQHIIDSPPQLHWLVIFLLSCLFLYSLTHPARLIRKAIMQTKTRSFRLELDEVPIQPGQLFRGVLSGKVSLHADQRIRFAISRSNATSEAIVMNNQHVNSDWSHTQGVEFEVAPELAERTPAGFRIPFEALIPPNSPLSYPVEFAWSDAYERTFRRFPLFIRWTLKFKIGAPGADYHGEFEIPVLRNIKNARVTRQSPLIFQQPQRKLRD